MKVNSLAIHFSVCQISSNAATLGYSMHNLNVKKKMADKTGIKVAVVEGDNADLCSLGLPLALSLQLQLLDLKLSGALWSAKASASGFSVSLYRGLPPPPAVIRLG